MLKTANTVALSTNTVSNNVKPPITVPANDK